MKKIKIGLKGRISFLKEDIKDFTEGFIDLFRGWRTFRQFPEFSIIGNFLNIKYPLPHPILNELLSLFNQLHCQVCGQPINSKKGFGVYCDYMIIGEINMTPLCPHCFNIYKKMCLDFLKINYDFHYFNIPD
ncbi:MAG TPA: hypothetical protein ENG89_00590 [Candidatus Moranbacteria bacterium]|nr:hypothetical protein [Candidatus Moranbacteria bacterium]